MAPSDLINDLISDPINEPVSDPINDPESDPINGSLSDVEKEILKMIHENPLISYDVLIAKLGKDRSTIKQSIRSLKLKKLLERSGSRKKGYWKVVELVNERN
jgi:ATP-dependent DNA helicase RecG